MRTLAGVLVFAVFFGFCLAGCIGGEGGGGGGGQQAVEVTAQSAIMPDADLVFSADVLAANSTPIGKYLTEESQDSKNSLGQIMDLDPETLAAVEKALGVTQKDVAGYSLSLKLEGVDFDNIETTIKQNPGQLPVLAALELVKEVTNEQLLAAAKIITEKKGGTVAEKDGMLVLSPPEEKQANDPSPDLLVRACGKTILIGIDAKQLEGAVARGAKAVFPEKLEKMKSALAVDGKAPQGLFVFALPQYFKDKLKEAPSQGPINMAPLKSLTNVFASANAAGDDLSVNLNLQLGSAQDAGGTKGLVDMALGMLSMQLPVIAEVAPKSTVNNDVLNISLSLTKDKIEKLQKAATGMMMGGMAPPPGMAPPTEIKIKQPE